MCLSTLSPLVVLFYDALGSLGGGFKLEEVVLESHSPTLLLSLHGLLLCGDVSKLVPP